MATYHLGHFDDARSMIERAQEHIEDFNVALRMFCDKEAWTTRIEYDPERCQYIHKISLRRYAPRKVKVIAREVFSALRAALDLTNAACIRLTSPTRSNSAHFPFAGDADSFESTIQYRSRGVPDAVKDYFRTLKPYKGGDDCLHALSTTRNDNDHWALTLTDANVSAVKIIFRDANQNIVGSKLFEIPGAPDPEREIEFMATSERDMNYELMLLTQLRFEGVPSFASRDCRGVLQDLQCKVTEIVDKTESIVRGLGLI